MMHVAGPCSGRLTRDRRQLADREQCGEHGSDFANDYRPV